MSGSNGSANFRLTLIHPSVGRRAGDSYYVRTWQMEPLPPAMIAALTPDDVNVRFYDDRLERIPFDEPTDLVAISVETYTARRAYQIASDYRRRSVPVVMGGFHATLCPDEVREHCESLVVGEAEQLFPELIDDYRHGRAQREYRSTSRPKLTTTPDRTIFRGKRYLPIRLVEFARGCRFKCDFCAIQSFFDATQTHRDVDRVLAEVQQVRRRGQMVFFIDDNIVSDLAAAKDLCRALAPLKLRWVSQASITVAFDEEALHLLRESGCQGLLIGFESLDEDNLAEMNKTFNTMRGGARAALENMRRAGLRVYGTFIFGYDHDGPESFQTAVDFCQEEGLFIAAFNHITRFPARHSTTVCATMAACSTMPGGSTRDIATTRCRFSRGRCRRKTWSEAAWRHVAAFTRGAASGSAVDRRSTAVALSCGATFWRSMHCTISTSSGAAVCPWATNRGRVRS